MYDIANIRTQIKTLLQSVVNGSAIAVFAYVYDFPNPNPEGYPCAIMDISADDGEFLDNITNLHRVTFTIWLVQEITVQGQENAIDLLDVASKYTIQALEKLTNASLSGNILWSSATTGPRKQVQTENGPVFYKEIILKCNVTSAIN